MGEFRPSNEGNPEGEGQILPVEQAFKSQDEVVQALLGVEEYGYGDERLANVPPLELQRAGQKAFLALAMGDANDFQFYGRSIEKFAKYLDIEGGPDQEIRSRLETEVFHRALENGDLDLLKRIGKYCDLEKLLDDPAVKEVGRKGVVVLLENSEHNPFSLGIAKSFAEKIHLPYSVVQEIGAEVALEMEQSRPADKLVVELNLYKKDLTKAAKKVVDKICDAGDPYELKELAKRDLVKRYQVPIKELLSLEQRAQMQEAVEKNVVDFLERGIPQDVDAIFDINEAWPIGADFSERHKVTERLMGLFQKAIHDNKIAGWGWASEEDDRSYQRTSRSHGMGDTRPLSLDRAYELLVLLNFSPNSEHDKNALAEGVSALLEKRNGLADLEPIARNPKNDGLLAWAPGIRELAKLQARSGQLQHDPWMTDLSPLVSYAIQERLISTKRPDDIQQVLAFVRRYGAQNLHGLFRATIALESVRRVSDLPVDVANDIRIFVGEERYNKLSTSESAFVAIENSKQALLGELLKDRVPYALDSALGAESFMGLIKGGTWEGSDSLSAILDTWNVFQKTDSEDSRLPQGYESRTFSVPLRERVERTDEEKQKAILSDNDLQVTYKAYHQAFAEGRNDDRLPVLVKNRADQVLVAIDKKIEGMAQRLSEVPEKAKSGMVKAIEKTRQQRSSLEKIVSGIKLETEQDLREAMEAISTLETWGNEEFDLVRLLSAAHMKRLAQPFDEKMAYLGEFGECDDAGVPHVRDVGVNYIAEHYLAEDSGHAGHQTFSPELKKRLEKTWRLVGGRSSFVAQRAMEKLDALSAGTFSGKQEQITMVPAQGLLRIYSGRLGDSCHALLERELAEGQYQGLHAYAFVADKDSDKERFVGSVLFVETTTEDGDQTVLVVRANNPRENFIQSVDAKSFVKEVVAEAIAVAKRRGIDHVVIPADEASKSNSNRPAVTMANEAWIKKGQEVSLVEEPETTFNGYPIWNAFGENKTVVVWSKEGVVAPKPKKQKKARSKQEGFQNEGWGASI